MKEGMDISYTKSKGIDFFIASLFCFQVSAQDAIEYQTPPVAILNLAYIK